MAFDIRKLPDEIVFGLVEAHNQRMVDAVGSSFHADTTSTTSRTDYTKPVRTDLQVTAANASDLATSIALVNDIYDVVQLHFADTLAHDSAVSAALDVPVATDLATAITRGNALKAAVNTHHSAANVHYNNDGTNWIAAADASDQSSLNTLLNEMKGDVNAHIVSAPAGAMINLVNA